MKAVLLQPDDLSRAEQLKLAGEAFASAVAEAASLATSDEDIQLFEKMRSYLEDFESYQSELLEMAQEVAGASAELSASAEESSLAVDQITGTVQELAAAGQRQGADAVSVAGSAKRLEAAIADVAQGAERQAASARESARSVDQASVSLSESRGVLEAVMDSVTHNSELARRGSESVDAVSARIDEIVSATRDVEGRIRELEGHSHEIGRILDVIRDIADQTNLLALNAAIEAARAGEHGRGFAVVADEVRKLAEKSSAETKAIGTLVQSIVESTGSAVRAMAGGARAVGAGKEVSSQASAALEEIARSSSQLGKLVEKLIEALGTVEGTTSAVKQHMSGIMDVAEANTSAARSMRADAGQVRQDVSGVASLAEENAASIQEVSASAEQVAASLKGMADSTGILTDMAQKLRLEVGRFKVS